MTNGKIFKRILQVLFFLTLISPLVIDRRLFFPYVTGSALYFRLIVEALFLLWLIFVLIYPKFRPKLNILIGSIGIYLLALIAATVFSPNPYLSFWGDAERMMGLFSTLHFFALFLIGTTLFKDKKELRLLITVFVGVSLIVCLYGILQRLGFTSIKPGSSRILATMGNAGVLAAYLIFGLFLSIYLALTDSKNILKIIFGSATLIHLIAVILSGTRGAYLGVITGFLVAISIIIYKAKEKKKLRQGMIIAIILLAVLYGFLFISKNQEWVKNNYYLSRLTSFSLSDVTVKTRLMSWQWGLKGFYDKPILGYGFENFAIPYNKNFQAEYYNYSPTKPYFDRAHNIVVELLATTGIIGFISYLLILVAVFYCLIRVYKDKQDYIYLSVISGLVVAYFVQNLLIFDMLPAMLGFMVLLIFINNNYQDDEEADDKIKPGLNKRLIFPIALILLFILFQSYSKLIIKPYKAMKDDVIGQMLMPYDYNSAIKYLKDSVSYNTVFDLDLRSAAANTIFNYYRDNDVEGENKKDDIDFAINLYKDNLKYLPDDTYYNYKIAEILNYNYSLDLDEKIILQARKHIDKAISTSPNRVRNYYLLSENLLMAGQLDKAEEAVKKAVSLNDKFGESYWELAKVCYTLNKYDEAKYNLIKTVDLGYRLQEQTILGLMSLFNVKENLKNEIEFLELVIKNGTDNYLYYSTLANRYYETGNKEKAIKYAQEAVKLNPNIKEDVDKFIKKINE